MEIVFLKIISTALEMNQSVRHVNTNKNYKLDTVQKDIVNLAGSISGMVELDYPKSPD